MSVRDFTAAAHVERPLLPAGRSALAEAPDHFVAIIDRAHLRIYHLRDPENGGPVQFELAESFDFPAGHRGYLDRDRWLAVELAEHLERFLREHPEATWDFAAGPGLHHSVLDDLSPSVRVRLGVAVVKELNHQTPAQLRSQLGL
jgi:hypothetical protein